MVDSSSFSGKSFYFRDKTLPLVGSRVQDLNPKLGQDGYNEYNVFFLRLFLSCLKLKVLQGNCPLGLLFSHPAGSRQHLGWNNIIL